uniref:RNA-directed DNA polymerase, eukaryota, reverse transcriptase zinc-binding domain protein n=1 Tax=Tanacetum cinerariifolium TaxID=118510 RepID=A0A699GXN5_TANCI|nr:RNA-directed DNA polymerase, eukaryota, reverse transcriptase zinc-binding domain protein [Tanacetum cinerariifolium]
MEKARSNRYMSDLETSKISLQSKFDQTSKISKSVFISNFLDDCTSMDLWKVCNDYATLVDVFILNKKSKAGKRFAFFRFIKVLNFGIQDGDRKITWVKWSKVLASKKYGGLGVSSFYALNQALLFKWVWCYLSHDNSLWSRVISAIHGLNGQVLSTAFNSTWSFSINEVNSLKDKGVDLISHCKIKVGKDTCTSFWNDLWIGDSLLKLSFPRLYALEGTKHVSVADKMRTSISFSFRRPVQGGVESQQHDHLSILLDSVI